jgi:DNA polymerase-3 subunit epsilon
MRQVILDTETTGLDPAQGHRVIEIGAVEVMGRQLTGQTFHVYLNPDREVDAGAQAVHGLSNAFLADKPRFAECVEAFLAFIADAELIIHNAPFDVGFLDAELARLDRRRLQEYSGLVSDSLKLARELHPGQKNNLDALCRRYEVDNSGRKYHGALLDAELLAEVWLAMTRGQESLLIESLAPVATSGQAAATHAPRPVSLKVLRPTPAEMDAHQHYLQGLSQESRKAPLSW